MRYRLLASYQGAPYEAGIGPDESGVVLFAACPPPEDLRFEPATGHWRKEVSLDEVQMIYESRPVGTFRGEPCVVLDDLNDRLHIAYLGHDAYLAERLGYWEVDRSVFELITPRQEVTDIVEERLPLALRDSGRLGPLGERGPLESHGPLGPAITRGSGRPASTPPIGPGLGLASASRSDVSIPAVDEAPLPLEAEAMRAASAAARKGKRDQGGRAAAAAADTAGAADAADAADAAADMQAQPTPPTQASAAALRAQAPPAAPPAVAAAARSEARPGKREPAPALAPAAPAGLSEPSSMMQQGADAAASMPSWTPQPHVPPQRPAVAEAPAAADASRAEPLPAERPTPGLSQPTGPNEPSGPAGPASLSQPAGASQALAGPAPESIQPDTGLVHGVPLPPSSPMIGQSAPSQQPQSRTADAARPSTGSPLTPVPGSPPGHQSRPDQPSLVNGAMREGPMTLVGAPLGPGPADDRGTGKHHQPVPIGGLGAAAPLADQAPDALIAPVAGQQRSEPAVAFAVAPPAVAPSEQPAPRRRRAARRRLPTQRIFSELAAQAAIPASAYAIGEDIDGAMCLVRTEDGFEVFNSLAGARHEVRVFQDEESAYFYLFGVLVADAVRTGALAPRQR